MIQTAYSLLETKTISRAGDRDMTLEYAAQLVDSLRQQNNNEAAELFSHFVEYFDMSEFTIIVFAQMSGYATVSIVK